MDTNKQLKTGDDAYLSSFLYEKGTDFVLQSKERIAFYFINKGYTVARSQRGHLYNSFNYNVASFEIEYLCILSKNCQMAEFFCYCD